jgi:NhaA family Na+:H+ antiporter
MMARPILRFIHTEVASGVVLIIAAAVALVWVNSPWADSYDELWNATIDVRLGSVLHFEEHLHKIVNDGLMTLFFLVVGLEIKRELAVGQLSDPRAAALPALAAVGGMVVPAALYVALNPGGAEAGGWGIAMATDIAFAVGVVALLGSRVHPRLKLFLLTLAIVDDVGAILVIAVFYTDDLEPAWLALTAACVLAVVALRALRVWAIAPYVAVGVVMWYATFESGVHATIAGVLLGLLAPTRPLFDPATAQQEGAALADGATAEEVRHARFVLDESISVCERLEYLLHPWTGFVIIPVFALANAGIEISASSLRDAASSTVTWGVIVGLAVGKPLGITLFTWLGTRLGLRLPSGLDWRQVLGLGLAGGIGFTVAIFVTGLAFEDEQVLLDDAKVGIFVASFLAAAAALAVLRTVSRPASDSDTDETVGDDEPPVRAVRQTVPTTFRS